MVPDAAQNDARSLDPGPQTEPCHETSRTHAHRCTRRILNADQRRLSVRPIAWTQSLVCWTCHRSSDLRRARLQPFVLPPQLQPTRPSLPLVFASLVRAFVASLLRARLFVLPPSWRSLWRTRLVFLRASPLTPLIDSASTSETTHHGDAFSNAGCVCRIEEKNHESTHRVPANTCNCGCRGRVDDRRFR